MRDSDLCRSTICVKRATVVADNELSEGDVLAVTSANKRECIDLFYAFRLPHPDDVLHSAYVLYAAPRVAGSRIDQKRSTFFRK
jgi:hypothetical protein